MEGTLEKLHAVKVCKGTQKFERIVPNQNISSPDKAVLTKAKVNL
jgi:hypothetical protein